MISKMDPMSKHTSERKRLPFMVWQLENGSLQRLAWPMIVFDSNEYCLEVIDNKCKLLHFTPCK